MKLSRLGLTIVVGCVLAWAAAPASAQPPLPLQNRPTLSPWLNLYRNDSGPVGPYLSNVRPEQRLLGTLSRQRQAISRQNAAITALRSQSALVTADEALAPTGTGATFMNYSHFYGNLGGGGGRGGPTWSPPSASRGGYSAY